MRVISTLVIAVALVGRAAADPAKADALAAEANAAARTGDFAGAAAKFRAAYAEDPRPELVCNVGVAYYKANDLVRAHHYLSTCQAQGAKLDAKFVANVAAVVQEVESELAKGPYVRLDFAAEPANATITVVGAPFDDPVTGRVWLELGHYRATIHADGFVDQTLEIDASAKQPQRIAAKLLPQPEPTPIPNPNPNPNPIPTPRPNPHPTPIASAPPEHHSYTPALVASGTTIVVGTLAVLAFTHALSINDQAAAATDFKTYEGYRSSTLGWEHASWAAGSIAAAGAVISGLLWYRAVHVEIEPASAVVAFTTRF